MNQKELEAILERVSKGTSTKYDSEQLRNLLISVGCLQPEPLNIVIFKGSKNELIGKKN